MIRCEKCGKTIRTIVTNRFEHDGSDKDIECVLEEVPDNAVVFRIDDNWCGYGLDEDEQRDSIRCPYCDKFPFKYKEVQVQSFLEVAMFKEDGDEKY
jgi:DNA-directed RNA polymerase subunit RPC12/RpoP